MARLGRKYLFAIAGTATVVFAAGFAVEVWTSYRQLQQSTSEILLRDALLAATKVQNRVEIIQRQLLEGVSIPWSDSSLLRADKVSEMERTLKALPEITDVTLSEVGLAGGIQVSRLVPNLELKNSSVADDSIVKTVARGTCKVVSLNDSSAVERPITRIFCRAFQTDWYTAATISLEFVSDLLQQMRTISKGNLYVVDINRRLLAHSDTSTLISSFGQPQQIVQTDSLSFWHIVTSVLGAVDNQYVQRDVPLPDWQWRVIVERPIRDVIGPLVTKIFISAATAFVAILLLLVSSAVLAESLARPVRQLEVVARSIGEGNLAARSTLRSETEIGSLAHEINRMGSNLEHHTRNLEQRVLEQTLALSASNKQLENISRHKSEFLAHMSHELRTPLNAVIGFSDLLKAQYFGALNQKQSEYVRDINASGQHLLSLINDILDLAKVEAGRMELMLSDSLVPTLVESCVSLVSERVSRSRQTLTTDVASDVATWPLDDRKVKQCLLNLLTNASKFTPVGGVIALRVSVASNELVAAVSDNGVGIAAQDLPKLFSEFYQAKAADDASGVAAQREGTGLGLALTKGFVELHGGTISVESVVGKGSTFTMRFPGLADGGVDKAALEHAENLGAAK